ncbi:hypothetical protein CEXT_373071 [Caerostris extrusa]|uniref:BZIP domain-containing protein n=1 Tax=Caerostris extrusa TaxID=172846 RepID=A0AAV4UBK0_CAEEX|nr:hypothetical protein CEXT_373071 [Caerostris extrusa]
MNSPEDEKKKKKENRRQRAQADRFAREKKCRHYPRSPCDLSSERVMGGTGLTGIEKSIYSSSADSRSAEFQLTQANLSSKMWVGGDNKESSRVASRLALLQEESDREG